MSETIRNHLCWLYIKSMNACLSLHHNQLSVLKPKGINEKTRLLYAPMSLLPFPMILPSNCIGHQPLHLEFQPSKRCVSIRSYNEIKLGSWYWENWPSYGILLRSRPILQCLAMALQMYHLMCMSVFATQPVL